VPTLKDKHQIFDRLGMFFHWIINIIVFISGGILGWFISIYFGNIKGYNQLLTDLKQFGMTALSYFDFFLVICFIILAIDLWRLHLNRVEETKITYLEVSFSAFSRRFFTPSEINDSNKYNYLLQMNRLIRKPIESFFNFCSTHPVIFALFFFFSCLLLASISKKKNAIITI
jgi:hypothetical protein